VHLESGVLVSDQVLCETFGVERLLLTKYEAIGNDFLILFDGAGSIAIAPELVAQLCDRHRGVGADGLIQLRPTSNALAMVLHNADGSPAEVSGNGLRCAALAAFDAGVATGRAVVIATVVGQRRAELIARQGAIGELSVEMGEVRVDPTASPIPNKDGFRADIGNPHLVLLGDRNDDVDLAVVGPELEAAWPGGQNVEIISVSGTDELDLVVFERGAGITEACGTGSCAAAAAARIAGAVGDVVTVHNPGGSLRVELGPAVGNAAAARLTGPARRVAEVNVSLEDYLVP
jgi:diaminopimelate epimerase